MEFEKTFVSALMIYMVSCYVLYTMKPSKMFDDQGNFKNFGLESHETVFPFWLVTTVIGISTYYGLILTRYLD